VKITTKSYKINKIKNYIKNNKNFFLFAGNTMKSYDWIIIEQILTNIDLKYYKIYNNTTMKIFDQSIFRQTKTTLNSITFFIKPNNTFKLINKKLILNRLKSFFFSLIAIKINNNIYSIKQIKNTYSIKYKTKKLFLYQTNTTNLKTLLT
jgi:hypothetical protein